ncbi:MAG: glycosyltransferase [Anaerolineales bacterium]|nr:glycosyltransferase [Anaerolineales bacterium]
MTAPDFKPVPTFSVVINTTDRARPLRTLLRGLEQQSYRDFEVIVVVGPTQDDTLAMLAPFADRLRVIRCPVANLGHSRNLGIQAATGEIVAFIDDDASPSVNWLAQLAAVFVDPQVDATGGAVFRIDPPHAEVQFRLGVASSLAEAVDVRDSWLQGLTSPRLGRALAPRVMGTNMAMRRQALLDIGGFDEFYEWVYDETDLCLRLAAAGKLVQPVHEAVVYHAPASSRYREVHKQTARWWILTKAALYFTLQHGRRTREDWSKIGLRCLYLMHGRFLWGVQQHQQGVFSIGQVVRMWIGETRGWAAGIPAGLWGAPRLMPVAAGIGGQPSSPDQGPAQAPPKVVRFPAGNPSRTAFDPVTGATPQIAFPTAPLRICLLSAAYPPLQSEGVGRHTQLMAQGLFELGHTIHVVAEGAREQTVFAGGAYLHRIPASRIRYPQYRTLPKTHQLLNYSHSVHEKVLRLQANDGIEIVDSPVWGLDGLVTVTSGLLPVVVRPQTALRQVSELQHNLHDDFRAVGELEQALIARAAALAPNSNATVKALQSVYHLSDLPKVPAYRVIPHGIIPVTEAEVRPVAPTAALEKATILYVGRLEKRKGILDLFAAIPRVLQHLPGVHFVIAGADNSVADGFQPRTGFSYPDYFAREHPTALANVQFTGAVSEEELQTLYQRCDLFLAPSLYESFGLIYLEAMNYGKAVIGCTTGGVPEVVENGVTGLLVDPEAPAQLAEAIVKLLRNPRLLHDYGLAGRQRLLERFTYVQMARSFAELYQATLAQQGARQ